MLSSCYLLSPGYMFYSFKLYLVDRWILATTLASLLLLAALGWYTISNVRPTPDNVFLHYNIVFGTDLVGEWQAQLIPFIVGCVVFIVNNLFSWMIFGSNRLLGRLVVFFTMAVEISLLVGQIFMLNLNI